MAPDAAWGAVAGRSWTGPPAVHHHRRSGCTGWAPPASGPSGAAAHTARAGLGRPERGRLPQILRGHQGDSRTWGTPRKAGVGQRPVALGVRRAAGAPSTGRRAQWPEGRADVRRLRGGPGLRPGWTQGPGRWRCSRAGLGPGWGAPARGRAGPAAPQPGRPPNPTHLLTPAARLSPVAAWGPAGRGPGGPGHPWSGACEALSTAVGTG